MGNGNGNAANLGENTGNVGNWDGNAGNIGGNVGNQGGNAGNRTKVEKTKQRFTVYKIQISFSL